jgi:large subunit ribosomal protein L22
MEAIASAKFLPGSPQKARLVVDMIRGKNVNNALAILQFSQKRAAKRVAACLRSAIYNAVDLAQKNNIAIDENDLWVKLAYVDQGPTKNRRRMRPAPQGRAYKERRHFCHITVQVSTEKAGAVSGNGKAATAAKGKKQEASEAPTPEKKGAAKKPAKKAATKTSAKKAAAPRAKKEAAPKEKEAPKPRAKKSTKEKKSEE